MSRPGLRTRVTLMFSAGALLLSTALAVSAYHLTARHLVAERERTAVRSAYFDAAVLADGLSGEPADVLDLLRTLDTGQSRKPLLRQGDRWFARGADDGLTKAVPSALLTLVAGGEPALQRIRVAGQPAVVVGIPLPRFGYTYFEVQSLAEVQSTLTTLSRTLTGVALSVTVGAALLSSWTSGRALSPLRHVARAAAQVSAGDLTVTIAAGQDRDLTPLAEAFNTMVREVSERIERDRRFAADVSHELRSPLQTLTAASSVLLTRTDRLDERTASAARLVADEAQRFATLVQDLLDIARADLPAVRELVDVEELVWEVCDRAGVPVVVIDVAPDIGLWPLDRTRVQQVLRNVLENAAQHGGGVVRVAAMSEGRSLVLEVDDQGVGVPPDEREKLFDRFARGSAAHSRAGRDGTGLGLALVAQHAAAHGGRAAILDRPGGGCRVRVTFPREGAS